VAQGNGHESELVRMVMLTMKMDNPSLSPFNKGEDLRVLIKRARKDRNMSKQGIKTAILEETFAQLRSFYEREGIEPGTLFKIGLKPGWTVVIGRKGECGTAFRFSGPHNVYERNRVDLEVLKRFVGRNLMDVVSENLGSALIPVRSVAVAAMSALSQPFISADSLAKRGLRIWDDQSLLESVVTPHDIVTLVGYGGMTQNLLGKCKELHVADMRPRESLLSTMIGDEIEYEPKQLILHGPEEDEAILGRSDVVIITASSLVNGTFDDLIRYASHARVVGLYGPSASIIPDVLFEHGVDFIMSHHVINPQKFIDSVLNDMNMESALRNFQRYQTMLPAKRK
jgi:uncharacterized protein (DUF4213/DUF364 family)